MVKTFKIICAIRVYFRKKRKENKRKRKKEQLKINKRGRKGKLKKKLQTLTRRMFNMHEAMLF